MTMQKVQANNFYKLDDSFKTSLEDNYCVC